MSDNSAATSAVDVMVDCYKGVIERDDKTFNIDPLLCRLVEFFIHHPGQIISRKTLAEQVWCTEHISDEAINRSISILRKSLANHRNTFIVTVPRQGYRFSIPKDLRFKYQPLNDSTPQPTIPQPTIPQPAMPQQTALDTQRVNTGYFVQFNRWAVAFVCLSACLIGGLTFWWFNAPVKNDSDIVAAKSSYIVMIPFEQVAGDQQQQQFADGLSELILNNLTRIKGLMVADKGAAFRPSDEKADEKIDVTSVAKKLGVDYVLKGTIRKNGQNLRVVAQLLEVKTQTYLFSTVFEQKLNDVFLLQQKISQNVATAVKLSFDPRPNQQQYYNALSKLSYVSLEKLINARAKVHQQIEPALKSAVDTLQALNQQYPHNSEIMGLLAYASSVLASIGAVDESYSRQTEVELAQEALTLDPANIDALMTLYSYYDDFADLRDKNVWITGQMLHYHPGRVTAYKLRLDQLSLNRQPCETIQQFFHTLPANIYSSAKVEAYKTVIDSCFSPMDWAAFDQAQRRLINRAVHRFELHRDMKFAGLSQLALRYPNQRFSSQMYRFELAMGANEAAAQSGAAIDHSKGGYWSWLSTVYATLHDQPIEKKPSDFIDFVHRVFRSAPDPYYVAALTLELSKTDNKQILADFLAKVPPFKINMSTYWEAIGLMVLQYHGGEIKQAQDTAQKLLVILTRYRAEDPQSYQFWSLAQVHLMSAMYAGQTEQAEQILNSGFAANEAWWLHDSGLIRAILLPWADTDVVKAYMQRIEDDALRARQKFARE